MTLEDYRADLVTRLPQVDLRAALHDLSCSIRYRHQVFRDVVRGGIGSVGNLEVPGVQAESLDLDEYLCRGLDRRLCRVSCEREAGKVFAVGEGVLLHYALEDEPHTTPTWLSILFLLYANREKSMVGSSKNALT